MFRRGNVIICGYCAFGGRRWVDHPEDGGVCGSRLRRARQNSTEPNAAEIFGTNQTKPTPSQPKETDHNTTWHGPTIAIQPNPSRPPPSAIVRVGSACGRAARRPFSDEQGIRSTPAELGCRRAGAPPQEHRDPHASRVERWRRRWVSLVSVGVQETVDYTLIVVYLYELGSDH